MTKPTEDQMPAFYDAPDDLPEGLRKYCESWSTGYRFMHPFRFGCFPFGSDTDILSDLADEERAFEAELEQQQWCEAITRVEGWKYRFEYINSRIEPRIPKSPSGDAEYWEAVIHAIRNSTNLACQSAEMLKALDCPRSGKLEGLCGEDYQDFLDMDKPIVGWRGVNADSIEEARDAIRSGFSWSMRREKAVFFGSRRIEKDGKAFVASAEFSKGEIEAYFPSLGEGEFIARLADDKQFDLEEVPRAVA